jgi:adenine-specific DNA-methyltransferase
MKKLKMHSKILIEENLNILKNIFPTFFTEKKNDRGKIVEAIDFDCLKQEMSDKIVDGSQERYQLNWPGKKKAILEANTPIAKTLRPVRKESVDFENTQNLFIEGDNLDALKLLQETYLEKIKFIYIDPPYNTGNDFIYLDDYSLADKEYKLISEQTDAEGKKLIANPESNGRFHSSWLTMMYSRIKLAKNLLKEDGVIFISIDDNEVANLKKICDEIFSAQNFVCTLIWNKQHSQQQGLFKKYHEYILLYAKNFDIHSNISGGIGEIEAGALKKVSKVNPESEFTFPAGVRFDAKDGFELTGTFGDSEKVRVVKGVLKAKNGKTTDAVTLSAGWTQKEQMKKYFSGSAVLDTKGQKVLEFYFSSTGKLKCRKERTKITPPTLLPEYGMISEQTAYLSSLFGKTVFDNPKPVQMIRDFIGWFVEDNDIVLDFFAGSGTTCEAVLHESNLAKFIAVQLPAAVDSETESGKAAISLKLNTISEICKERIRLVGKKIKEENPDRDVGFRVLKIDSSNMHDVYYNPDLITQDLLINQQNNIKSDRTAEDLLFQILIDCGIDLSLSIEKEELLGKEVYCVSKNTILVCLDDKGGIDENFVKIIAKKLPTRIVFRDSGFKSDSVKINVEQIFKLISPNTEIKFI